MQTWIRDQTFVDVFMTCITSKSSSVAVTLEVIDQIRAFSRMTWITFTFIDFIFTFWASIARFTKTFVELQRKLNQRWTYAYCFLFLTTYKSWIYWNTCSSIFAWVIILFTEITFLITIDSPVKAMAITEIIFPIDFIWNRKVSYNKNNYIHIQWQE